MAIPSYQEFMLPLLRSAIGEIAPVRNAIAHVREVEQNALMRATVACEDVLAMLRRAVPESKV